MPTFPQPALATLDEVYYPAEDDQPMGETDWHLHARTAIYLALKGRYADREDVYVASDLFLYYEEGNPTKKRAPDCMVVFGVGKQRRRTFQTWKELAVPSVVFEVASDSTHEEDFDEKCALYALLGVPEYFLFDPEGHYFEPPLQGLALRGGRYVAMTPDAEGTLTSRVLGLRLVPMGATLRFIDLETGEPLLTPDEKDAALRREANRRRTERRRADREKRRAESLAAEVERLKAMLEAQRRAESERGG